MKRQKRYTPEIISVSAPDYSDRAGKVIRGGGITAIPTETYYGLAADPFNEDALKKIYKLKQRSEKKPVLVLIEKIEQLSLFVEHIPDSYLPLIEQWWPGPLTLIFPALPDVSKILTGNTGSIGIRLTSSIVAKKICSASGAPVTATSANLSGQKAAINSSDVIAAFGGRVDLIIDGGESEVTVGSTIVGMKDDRPYVIRPGVLNLNF